MQNLESLLTQIMNFLAEQFKGKLILRGGMLLRLLGSPRATSDLDYVWIRSKKRDQFAADIASALLKFPGIEIKKTVCNSMGIILEGIELDSQNHFKIEIHVVKKINLPPETLNTISLADQYALSGRLIATLALPENFSHKIAAAIERGLARDFFDIMNMEGITDFDPATLKERMAKIAIDRQKPRKILPEEAAQLLRTRLKSINETQLRQELSSWLKPERMVGLRNSILMSLNRICQQIENIPID